MMDSGENSQTKTWLGSSISEICKGKGPWSFSITPVNASKYHAVLYQLPVTLTSTPKPYRPSKPVDWHEDYVRMPYSEKNLYPVIENGKDVIKSRWALIKESLSKPIKDSRELETAILKYNRPLPEFFALHHFFEEVLNEDEAQYFFSNLLPKIIKLALQLPEIVPGSLPLLKKNHNRSVSLSQVQIACLLANAFLCTFPWKKDMADSCPGVNFVRLFASHGRPKRQNCVSEKIKCIFNYFRRVTEKDPLGVVTFERKFIPKSNMPRWDTCKNNLGNTKVHINSEGTIEDNGHGFLQVDFANKNVGGGVLGYGCVQEEIRFVICPELIIGRLFIEQLGDHEAIIVTGVERYSNYSGYSDAFKWEGNVNDETPRDEYGRRRTTISIIDATHYFKPRDQFYPSAMLRELNKAYVGFSSREKDNLAPVATGNWGCGAFKGSSELKSLLQLIACSASGRDLAYFSFGNETLRHEIYNICIFFANNRITVAQLWRFLCGFASLGLPQEKLYSYIQQAFFDSKKQPTIKKFFEVNRRKPDNDMPSTSSKNVQLVDYRKRTSENKNQRIAVEKQSPVESIEDTDEDIIPCTPEAYIVEKKVVKSKFKFVSEDITEKLPKTDITELIDILDGNANSFKERTTVTEEGSFLTEIDRLPKNIVENKSCATNEEKMDVDDCVIDILSAQNSPTTESKNAKRRITDYFQMKPSKSS